MVMRFNPAFRAALLTMRWLLDPPGRNRAVKPVPSVFSLLAICIGQKVFLPAG